ncbi:hypothetical protein AVEN_159522-1 [Araneus ventricosus]|uniref:Uncharacterized protein n=1 Tax=Araneus ventricosus TaxID=182803 RepID=A0A4Y2A1D2_ARAVE|nr:hypothetical protein AVEN_159522-1 [Araneus ventricosus]
MVILNPSPSVTIVRLTKERLSLNHFPLYYRGNAHLFPLCLSKLLKPRSNGVWLGQTSSRSRFVLVVGGIRTVASFLRRVVCKYLGSTRVNGCNPNSNFSLQQACNKFDVTR